LILQARSKDPEPHMTPKESASDLLGKTVKEVRTAAEHAGVPFTEAQIERVAVAVIAMRESAGRLRNGLARNDEPAFGFVHSAPTGNEK
jgi:hypothetical protein